MLLFVKQYVETTKHSTGVCVCVYPFLMFRFFSSTVQSRCLLDHGNSAGQLDHSAEGILPGERFDADQQCKHIEELQKWFKNMTERGVRVELRLGSSLYENLVWYFLSNDFLAKFGNDPT